MPDEEEEGEKRETIGIQPGGGDASPRQALEILAILPTQIEFHTSQLYPPPPTPHLFHTVHLQNITYNNHS